MAKPKRLRDPRCPDCGNVHDGMCKNPDHYATNDPRRAVIVGGQAKRLMGFGNKRS